MHTQVGKVFAAGNEDECLISALGRKKDDAVHMCVRPVGGVNPFPIVQLKAGVNEADFDVGNHQTSKTMAEVQVKWLAIDPNIVQNTQRPVIDFEAYVTKVRGLDNVVLRHIECSDSFSLALSSDGHVYGCGTFTKLGAANVKAFSATVNIAFEFVKIEGPERVTMIWAKNSTAFARTADNKLFSMGRPQQNRLGRKVNGMDCLQFKEVKIGRLGLGDILDVIIGEAHTVVIGEHRACSFGSNGHGETGCPAEDDDMNLEDEDLPLAEEALRGDFNDRVFDSPKLEVTRFPHLCQVYSFGSNADGQLGAGAEIWKPTMDHSPEFVDGDESVDACNPIMFHIPQYVDGIAPVEQVVSGSRHTLALTNEKENNVVMWGSSGLAQALLFPDQEDPGTVIATPIRCNLNGLRSIQISAGSQHVLILADPATIGNFKKAKGVNKIEAPAAEPTSDCGEQSGEKDAPPPRKGLKEKVKDFCDRATTKLTDSCKKSMTKVKAFFSALGAKHKSGSQKWGHGGREEVVGDLNII
ncbi:hypothetical protein HDU76_005772 [Blyttiomyces sp. JEL0837]|nr:hypothetical protein HDU76_005772 [Blyttiomyces sp. JEL0837]